MLDGATVFDAWEEESGESRFVLPSSATGRSHLGNLGLEDDLIPKTERQRNQAIVEGNLVAMKTLGALSNHLRSPSRAHAGRSAKSYRQL